MTAASPSLVWITIALALPVRAVQPQSLPIIDMHMHARTATHYGPPPQTMCAPVETMPTWDQRKPIEEGLTVAGPGCKVSLSSPRTDAELLQQTIATMERHNMVAVLGGRPELVAKWMSAAPGRLMPGLDFRLDRATGTAMGTDNSAPYRPVSPDSMRALHAAGKLKVLAEITNISVSDDLRRVTVGTRDYYGDAWMSRVVGR